MNRILTALFSGILLAGAFLVPATLQARQEQRPPDNTSVNKNQQPNADQASNKLSDRDMTKKIRQDVVADKSLSSYGHNVKIICKNGHVTLKGPVHSDDEKRAIEEHARKYAGDGQVDNQLMVKEDRGSKH